MAWENETYIFSYLIMEKCLAVDTAKLEMSKFNVQLESCVNRVLSKKQKMITHFNCMLWQK